jgi:hypothetical protein
VSSKLDQNSFATVQIVYRILINKDMGVLKERKSRSSTRLEYREMKRVVRHITCLLSGRSSDQATSTRDS